MRRASCRRLLMSTCSASADRAHPLQSHLAAHAELWSRGCRHVSPVLTHFVVEDVERSWRVAADVLGGVVVMEGEPSIVAPATGINVGGPTEDKPMSPSRRRTIRIGRRAS